MKEKKILPEFSSLKEIAEFWDDHDFTDYEDEFKEVSDLAFNIKNRFYLPITLDQYDKIESIARNKGITVESLISNWVEERLANAIN